MKTAFKSPPAATPNTSPWRLLTITALAILSTETLIMFLLPLLHFSNPLAAQFLDGVILTALTAPALYFSLLRPLVKSQHAQSTLRRSCETQALLGALLTDSLEDLPLKPLLQRALDRIASLPSLALQSKGSIFLVGDVPDTLTMAAQHNLPAQLQTACAQVPFGKCLCGRAAASGQVVFASCVNDLHDVRYEGMGPHGCYCVPITSADKLLGVLNLYAPPGRHSDPDVLQFLTTAARLLARIIERKQHVAEDRRLHLHLTEAEERYRRLFELSPDAIFIARERRVAFINPAGLKLFGASHPDQIVGKPVLELVHPDSRDVVTKRMDARLRAGESLPAIAEQYLRLDGTAVDVEVAATHFVADGKPAGLVIARDITERKKLGDQLRKLSQAVEQSPASILITDLAGRIEYVNPAFCQLTGYTREDLLGQNPRLLKSGQTPPDTYQQMWATLVAGHQWRGELCNRKKNGELFWEVAVVAPLRDTSGAITHFVGVKEDITERKHAEEHLRSSQARLQLQFDHMPLGCITWDRNDRVTSWNPAAEAMFGFTAQEALGKHPQQFLLPPELQSLPQQVAQSLAAGNATVQSTNQNLTKDGRTIQCEWTNVPLRDDDGALIGSLSMVQDITEKKSIEKQLLRAQRVESIGTLASGIAHDLNNILAPIMMSAQLLQLNQPGEEEAEMLATITASARRGADIVKQVLTFARGIEGQRVTLQPRHLIMEIQSIARETFPKSITFNSTVPKDLWTLTGDATQLHQVLLNLCVNARDAMPDGGTLLLSAENVQVPKAKARLFADGKAGPHVLIQVSDTGHGIPSAIIEKIFDPFFTTKEQGKGTGLGLSTVLGIVRSHGGFVDVQSEPSRGSTFKVYLPAKPGEAVVRADTARPPAPRGAGQCILVVDDEAHVRSITERTLTTHGYQVLLAANGKEALDLVVSHASEVRAVVTDIMMPVMDGVALAHSLQQSHPGMPVIACTGWGQEGIQAKLKGLGVESFLEKPYPSEDLLTALRRHLTTTS